jgi:tape measure domain-containing protein
MASIFDYQFNIGGNFTAAMDGMAESTGRFNAAVEQSSSGLAKWEQKFAAFGLIGDYVDRACNSVNGIVEVGANAELQLMNLKTLFGGNAEAAKEMYERISEYGKVTPYDKAGLLEAQRTMMSFGMSGEAAFSTLQQIGDIAMGDSQKLQSLSLAYAQMSSTGKLTGQDLMQMVNAGFNPLQEISKQTGKSVADLKKDMEKGAISVGMVEAAFRSATSEGGLFHNAIAEASETTAGKMASIQDTIEEIKVSIFNATGDLGLWINGLSQVMVPLSQIFPLLQGLWSGMKAIKNLQWASMWSNIKTKISEAYIKLGMYNGYLSVGRVQNLGFRKNVLQSAVALTRFATVGVFQALKGLGALLLSFVTTGATSVKFAGIASTSFATFKTSAVTACRAVGVAIKNIPIIGWVVAAIAALAAVGIYFWNTSAKFRAVLKGLWASFKAVFTGIGDMAKQVFGGIGDLIKAAFSLDGDGIKAALNKMKGGFADYSSQVGKAFNDAYNAEMAASKKEQKKKEKKDDVLAGIPQVEIPETPVTPDPTAGTLGTVGTAPASTSDKVKNVTVNVEKLVERFEIHTTNLQGDISHVKDMVSEVLLAALNDVNLAM